MWLLFYCPLSLSNKELNKNNFSLISAPLTSLLKNRPKSLSWTSAAEEAFHQLKEATQLLRWSNILEKLFYIKINVVE